MSARRLTHTYQGVTYTLTVTQWASGIVIEKYISGHLVKERHQWVTERTIWKRLDAGASDSEALQPEENAATCHRGHLRSEFTGFSPFGTVVCTACDEDAAALMQPQTDAVRVHEQITLPLTREQRVARSRGKREQRQADNKAEAAARKVAREVRSKDTDPN